MGLTHENVRMTFFNLEMPFLFVFLLYFLIHIVLIQLSSCKLLEIHL